MSFDDTGCTEGYGNSGDSGSSSMIRKEWEPLPRETFSLCPLCLGRIHGRLFERGGKVYLEKECPTHGLFEELYWSDADLYRRFLKFESRSTPVSNPRLPEESRGCPFDCGLCSQHRSMSVLANIDVTNRCNQSCPICFSNASRQGYLYEPSKEEIREMMFRLRRELPNPCPAVQFAGGEPTVREDLPELVSMARDLGFAQIQIATNGVRISHDPEYLRRLHEAGLSTLYLQFDGTRKESFRETRGYNALPVKLRALESCRRVGFDSVVLVQTLVKGINDDQIGDLIALAVKNRDIVRSVNVQPVSFTGRIGEEKRREGRITIPDFLERVERQTGGEIGREDFYPISCVDPLAALLGLWKGKPVPFPSCHPTCGVATFVFVEEGRLIPLTRFVDIEGVLELSRRFVEKASEGEGRTLSLIRFSREFFRLVDLSRMPRKGRLLRTFFNLFRRGDREALAELFRNSLFIGSMHFMDPYNFDLERVQRCVIHYSTPEGIIPFCTYNTLHRARIERLHSVPWG
jgi:hypothetical protein